MQQRPSEGRWWQLGVYGLAALALGLFAVSPDPHGCVVSLPLPHPVTAPPPSPHPTRLASPFLTHLAQFTWSVSKGLVYTPG